MSTVNNQIKKQNWLRWCSEFKFPKLQYRSIEKDYNISKNVNTEICSECGGACCKTCGCHFSPDDFEEISFEYLKNEIKKGYISIEYVRGEFIQQPYGVYILRIRNQNAPIVDTGEKRTPCILLIDKGCKLDYEHRPTGGKLYIPGRNMNCYSEYSIEECCYEWQPHQRVLYELKQYYKIKDIQCSL